MSSIKNTVYSDIVAEEMPFIFTQSIYQIKYLYLYVYFSFYA